MRMITSIPDEDSSLSSLLTSQSRLLENCVQLFLFPLINAAARHKKGVDDLSYMYYCIFISYKFYRKEDIAV